MAAVALDALASAKVESFFHQENKLALQRLAEQRGALAESTHGFAAASASAPTSSRGLNGHLPGMFQDVPTVRRGREHFVYNHTKSAFPAAAPSSAEKLTVGTRISLGRSRWAIEDASIFSVQDGKRLAQTPVKDTSTPWERARFERIRAAARESPLVGGYRLLPELTPGRAFLWGSLLALWGTVATVKLAARGLGIEKREDASGVLRAALVPYAEALAGGMEPLKAWLSLPDSAAAREQVARGEVADRLRALLGHTRQG